MCIPIRFHNYEEMISGFGELLRLSPQVHEDLIVQSNGLEMGFAGAANILADLSHWEKVQLITALPENPRKFNSQPKCEYPKHLHG